LYRTFGYIGAIFSSRLISLTFGARTTDAGLHRLAWTVIGIGAATLLLTLLDRTTPVAYRRTGDADA
jgi:uncharacterized membrane protein YuzA (DUF378 family)